MNRRRSFFSIFEAAKHDVGFFQGACLTTASTAMAGSTMVICVCISLVNATSVSGQSFARPDAEVHVQTNAQVEVRAVKQTVAPMERAQNPSATAVTQTADDEKALKWSKRQELVLGFIQQHFPELQRGLKTAKEKHPAKFRKAVARIGREVVKLKRIEGNQPEKFEVAVEHWRLKTQIEITIAQFANKEDADQLNKRLEPLVKKLLDARKQMLEIERKQISDRLSRIDIFLDRLENKSDAVVRSNLRGFQESAEKLRNAKRKPASIFQDPIPADQSTSAGDPASASEPLVDSAGGAANDVEAGEK